MQQYIIYALFYIAILVLVVGTYRTGHRAGHIDCLSSQEEKYSSTNEGMASIGMIFVIIIPTIVFYTMEVWRKDMNDAKSNELRNSVPIHVKLSIGDSTALGEDVVEDFVIDVPANVKRYQIKK